MEWSRFWLVGRSMLVGLIISTLLFDHMAAAPTVYYVSLAGSDSNNGQSLSSAYRTIQKCADVAVAGDTCIIRGGVYRETVTIRYSGQAGNPITFAAYPAKESP